MSVIETSTSLNAEPLPNLYGEDLCLWANHNAALLRERRFDALDIEHLIEELTDMSKSDQRALYSHLKNLLMHLLKWQFQDNIQIKSWQYPVVNARLEIKDLLKDSPSLHPRMVAEFVNIYNDAKLLASVETGLAIDTFPATNPYSLEQVLDSNWLPNASN